MLFFEISKNIGNGKTIHAGQHGVSAEVQAREQRDFLDRIGLAERYARPGQPFLAITHGVSGSGKTYVSQIALERTGAIRLRSDIERKRLFGLAANQSSRSSLNRGIYTEQTSERTFERLAELARSVITAGYPVIVDATFIQHARRRAFAQLAMALNVPFVILSCRADDDVLEARIARRQSAGEDASEADIHVLRRQQQLAEALDENEQHAAIIIDSASSASLAQAAAQLASLAGAP
jgi:predicted kinase